jgi:replicative DNA helicase
MRREVFDHYAMGKLPPQAVDLENYILGACLISRDAVIRASSLIEPQMFYKEESKIIFTIIRALFNSGTTPDILSVTQALRTTGDLERVGGPLFISRLTDPLSSIQNLDRYCRIIAEKYLLRTMIEVSMQIQKEGYEEAVDCFELMDKMQGELSTALSTVLKRPATTTLDRVKTSLNKIDVAITSGTPPGLKTGLFAIDSKLGGLHRGKLLCFAARPGNGKSALMIAFAHFLAKNDAPSLYLNMEMEESDAGNRELSMYSGIPFMNLNNARLDDTELRHLHNSIGVMESIKVYVDFASNLDISQVKAKVSNAIKTCGIKAVFIDYLQIMNHHDRDYGTRDIAIGNTTRALKQLAKEENICVIMACQLSRETEKRSFGKPKISDLRESGNIENDCDLIGLLWNADNYEEELSKTSQWNVYEHKNELEINIVKNRQGALGAFSLYWDRPTNRIFDWNDGQPIPPVIIPDYNPNKTIEPNNNFLQNNPQKQEETPF